VTVLSAADGAERWPRPGDGGANAAPLIARDHLVARLDRAVEAGKVTVISAPAGSGKTSLLRTWARRPGQRHRLAVLQVQRGQHDAQLFWLALLDAVRAAVGAADDAEPLAAARGFNAAAMTDRVLAELAAIVGGLTLVIDDLHELGSPEAVAQLSRLLAHLPPRTHLVLATRRDLRLRLHQLRLAGQLAEIRAAELRFSELETRELLAASGITLSAGSVARLHQRSEGWAAGLRLAALSLAGHPDPERFVAEFSGSDRAVSEYLIAEMMDRQPAAVQDLLLRTCVLDRVNGELADLLTGRPGSERILLDLADANAFVVSLDPGRTWFRYHRLLSDFLRLELRRTLPAEVATLHRRAAGWFTGQGQAADAIRHTQAAGDWPDAARLLADHAFSMMLDGRARTIGALVRAFPPGEDQPELALVRAMSNHVLGRLDDAAAHLAVAESHAETAPPDRRRRLRMSVAAVRVSLARRRGHLSGVLDQVAFLNSPLSGETDEDIAQGSDLRALALMNLGTAEAWAPSGLADAERHLQQGAALAREIGRPYVEVGCLAQLAFASRIHSFATTQRRCREAIALAERYGWADEWVIAPALITMAATLVWTGEFDQGERWLQRARQARQADGGPDIRLLLHQTTGMLLACRGRHREALPEFDAADRLQSQLAGAHALASQVTGWRLATQARIGHAREARAALAALDDERACSGESGNARAVICLADGDPKDALEAVQPVLDGTAPVIGYVTTVEACLLAGLAHRELGDQRAAGQAVERALSLAEADRLVLPFAMTAARELLETLPSHQTGHPALRADILDVLHGVSRPATHPDPAPAAEPLSPSELRVLRYLPTNLSRPQIAGELSVSLNTVNTHLRSIYAKLQVSDRSAAVRRARELRLLAARALPAPRSADPGRLAPVAALPEILGQGRMRRVPVELIAGPGRVGALIEQQDLREVVAQTGSGLLVGTGDRARGIGRDRGRLGQLGHGRVQPVGDEVAAPGRLVFQRAPEEVRQVAGVHRGPVLPPGAEHDQTAVLVTG
jgi:LuxR family transcriptional regulator, maltose regulon positive regulatory protein